jgi:hypothetical protein
MTNETNTKQTLKELNHKLIMGMFGNIAGYFESGIKRYTFYNWKTKEIKQFYDKEEVKQYIIKEVLKE